MTESTWRTYVIFAGFGAGAAWFATSLCFMELPLYQKYFGLELSNRLEIGYNLGTLPCLIYLILKPSKKWLWALLVIQFCSVLLLCVAVPGSFLFSEKFLIIAQFLGGTVGYSAQFTAVPFLMHYENQLVGAFWTGDSATSVLAALVALFQRPARPRFGLFLYMTLVGLPVLTVSVVALAVILQSNIGRLNDDDDDDDEDLKDTDSLLVLSRRKDPQDVPSDTFTWALAGVCFWSQFADWGMGDSIYPFACANGLRPSLERCEMWSNELSLVAQFLGIALASKVHLRPHNLLRTLWLPTAVYTALFLVLLAMAVAPRPIFDDRAVVVVMAALRFLGPFIRNVVPRLIQPCYPRSLHDDMPVFFGAVGILGNVFGSASATLLIRFRYGKR